MALADTDGVVLVAHGTVSSLDELPGFLTRIRRGRPPSPELVAQMRFRYEAIGGSPLLEVTNRQAAALEERLGCPVLVAMRLWRPELGDTLREAASRGLRRLCVLPLAPFSVHVYHQAAERALAALAPELGDAAPSLVEVPPWGDEPSFVNAQVERIQARLGDAGDETQVLLTAHSLPTKIVEMGDPYRTQVEQSAAAIGAKLGRPWDLAYQSQGADGGDWLRPELKEVLAQVRERGARRVVLAPFGFLAEHVETLYDLDIEARGWASDLGLELVRVPALDTDPGLIEALTNVTNRALDLRLRQMTLGSHTRFR